MNKKVLILGARKGQIPLIQRAKTLGMCVVVCDNDINAPGLSLCDKHILADASDADKLVELIKVEKPDGICTTSEPLFIPMSIAASRTGLHCMDEANTRLFKNKLLMREFCATHNISSPAFKKCKKLEDATSFYDAIQKKCIIKPEDNCSSKGVYSINTFSDLTTNFNDCINNSSNREILIEEYINGTEFTIDGIVYQGRHYSLAISEKKHYAYNENVAYELLFSQKNSRFDYEELRRVNDELVEATKVPFALTHSEYKYHDGKYYLIEIQARGGGNYISTDIVPFLSGIDPQSLLLQWCVNDNIIIDFKYNQISEKCSVLKFFDLPIQQGVVEEIKGIDYLNKLGAKIKYEFSFNKGEAVHRATDDSNRVGWYILFADNREELDDTMNNISRKVQIILK